MKKNIRFLGLVVAGVVALLLPLKADAACDNSISFGSYYWGVSNTSGTSSLRSNFWTLNAGDPSTGAGSDNSTAPETGNAVNVPWLAPYGTIPLQVRGNWADNVNYGNCPPGDTDAQRMVFSFSDVNAGNMVYAVACVRRDTTAAIQFSLDPLGHDIQLVLAPKAAITNTVRNGGTAGANDSVVTVGVPDFTPGFNTDGSSGCDLATVIPQFDVYQQQTDRGVAPQSTRDAGTWVLRTTCNTNGVPACTFNTTCGGTNCDLVVATSPHYNSNFTTGEAATPGDVARVGANSAMLQAGPVLAQTPKFKNIKNTKIDATKQK